MTTRHFSLTNAHAYRGRQPDCPVPVAIVCQLVINMCIDLIGKGAHVDQSDGFVSFRAFMCVLSSTSMSFGLRIYKLSCIMISSHAQESSKAALSQLQLDHSCF